MCAAAANTGHDTEFSSQRIFLPPPPVPWRAELYRDLLNKLGLRREARRMVLDAIQLKAGESLLHAGCRDGAITLELKRRWPHSEIEGVYHDLPALKEAAEAAEAAGLHVLFKKGYLQDLPASAERHDVILCEMFLHRLRGEDRGDAFSEFSRVLKPGGRLLLLDFGARCAGLKGWLVHRLARHDRGIADQFDLGLPELCKLGGFRAIRAVASGDFGLEAVACEKT